MDKQAFIARHFSDIGDLCPAMYALLLDSVEHYLEPGHPCLPFDPTELVAGSGSSKKDPGTSRADPR
ncbi:MAG: hypothetical protein IPI05_05585 [Flavobacteriales bacterium]|nr:hypothetical protein [Flavobacteriales bacterium]